MAKTKQPEVTEENYENLLLDAEEDSETRGERYYAREFKRIYNRVRKGLVILNKVRNKVGNEEAYNKAVELLVSSTPEIEDSDEE